LTAGHRSVSRLEQHFNDVAVVECLQNSFDVNVVESLVKRVRGAVRSRPSDFRDFASVVEPDGGDDVNGHVMFLE
jgi:hypothetical protein